MISYSTRLEQKYGLHAGELSGVDCERLEPDEELREVLEEVDRVLGEHLEVALAEERGLVEGQAPLDGAQQEQLGPGLLQEGDL